MEERERFDIINHLAMTRLEVGDDAGASQLCAEALRQFPDNPAHYGCALQVMAWGNGPVQPDSAVKYFRELESRRGRGNIEAHAEFGLALAAVLARAGAHERARNVMGQVLTVIDSTPNDALRNRLLGLQAGVHFRLGDSVQGQRLFDEYARIAPREARILASRRVLRAHVDSTQMSKPR